MHESSTSKPEAFKGKPTFKLELDEKGYTRAIPLGDEKKRIEDYLSEEMPRAIDDMGPLWADAADNIRTYKATKISIDGAESVLPAPIARIPADQIIARTFNDVMRPRPIFSFDPYFDSTYPVVVPLERTAPDPFTGQPQKTITPVPVDKSAEEISRHLESGVEFKARERFDFADMLLKAVRGAVCGAPYRIKVCADPKYRTVVAPKIEGAFVDLSAKEEREIADGEIVKWYLVSYFNSLRPIDEEDDDESPWFAERTPESQLTFRTKAMTGEYFLLGDEDAEKLATNLVNVFTPEVETVKSETQNKTPQKPKQVVDKWLVWFNWPVKYVGEDGEKHVKEMSLCAHFHLAGRMLLDCYENPYDDKQRGYVLVDQMEDGDSTVGILKYFQTVFTHILQAEIKNAFHANNFSYWYDPDSQSATQFEGNKKIRIGSNIAGKFGDGGEWGVVRAGAEHYSLLPLSQFVAGLGQQASNVSSYEQGENIPGRTPAGTVSQILQQGAAQPILFLRRLNRALTKAMRLYLERTRQYQPMGETLPIKNEETRQIIEIPFRFPVGEVLDNFRISLTAADEAAAKEHEFEQQAMRLNLFQTFAGFVANVAGPISNPQATPAQISFFAKVVDAGQKIFDRIIGQDRTDEESFDLASAVNAIVEERQMAMQMALAGPQNGQMNAQGQVPPTGQAVPSTGAPDASGSSGMGGQPDVPMDSQPPMAEGGETQGFIG